FSRCLERCPIPIGSHMIIAGRQLYLTEVDFYCLLVCKLEHRDWSLLILSILQCPRTRSLEVFPLWIGYFNWNWSLLRRGNEISVSNANGRRRDVRNAIRPKVSHPRVRRRWSSLAT